MGFMAHRELGRKHDSQHRNDSDSRESFKKGDDFGLFSEKTDLRATHFIAWHQYSHLICHYRQKEQGHQEDWQGSLPAEEDALNQLAP